MIYINNYFDKIKEEVQNELYLDYNNNNKPALYVRICHLGISQARWVIDLSPQHYKELKATQDKQAVINKYLKNDNYSKAIIKQTWDLIKLINPTI